MSDTAVYSYSLEVRASAQKPDLYEWTIRQRGKLIQRSDRLQSSEEDARKNGLKAVERLR